MRRIVQALYLAGILMGAHPTSASGSNHLDNPGVDRHHRQLFHTHGSHVPRTIAGDTSGNSSVSAGDSQKIHIRRSLNFMPLAEKHDRRTISAQDNGSGNFVRVNRGVELDLSSSDRNIVLGERLFRYLLTIEINVGGQTRSFQSGSRVTAAEYLAIKQVLSGEAQKLLLASDGSASGGFADLTNLNTDNTILRASSLVVPVGVTVSNDFSRSSDFRLTGDLSNFGSFALSSSSNRGGFIGASNIYNLDGASLLSSADLTLNAQHQLVNSGTIESAGRLTIVAGDSLNNKGTIKSNSELAAIAPKLVNPGTLISQTANILLDSPSTLTIDNSGGTISALQGNIYLRSNSYGGQFDTSVNGGNLFSNEVWLNSGAGTTYVDAGKVSGTVNASGNAAHFATSSDNLVLGKICLTGDPTFKNDSGNIDITGDISVGEALAIIASGNVTNSNTVTISAASSTDGFPIMIVAGAAQTPGGTNSTTIPPGTASGTTINGGSVGGGSIVLDQLSTISSRATGKKGSGGNVSLIAFAGTNLGSGTVNLTSTSIFTGGRSGKDDNGDVQIIADSATGTSFLGQVSTKGGNLSSGDISLSTAHPISSNGLSIAFNANGQIVSGNSFTTSGAAQNGNLSVIGNLDSSQNTTLKVGGNIDLAAGVLVNSHDQSNILLNGNLTTASGASIEAGDLVQISASGNVGGVQAVNFNAPHIAVESLNGAINLQTQNNCEMTVCSAQSNITLKSGGSLNVNGDVVSNAGSVDITLTTTVGGKGGSFTLEESRKITAVGGINLINEASKSSAKMTFKEGSQVLTNPVLVPILIQRGAVSAIQAAAPKYSNIVNSGASVKFFGQQAKGRKPTSNFTANGADINVVCDKKGKIIFQGAILTAD